MEAKIPDREQVAMKLPWALNTDADPGCAKCSSDGVRAYEIKNADGEVIFSSGHEVYYMPEFDLLTIVTAVNALRDKRR